jgi:hypothetical protein
LRFPQRVTFTFSPARKKTASRQKNERSDSFSYQKNLTICFPPYTRKDFLLKNKNQTNRSPFRKFRRACFAQQRSRFAALFRGKLALSFLHPIIL